MSAAATRPASDDAHVTFDPEAVLVASADPLAEAAAMIERARAREPFDVTAMSLATVAESGRPSVRMVLLKSVDASGFTFFTNRESRKAHELDATGVAALCLHFPKGEEQLRVEGQVLRASDAESDAYFATRARASQLGAWASKQSAPLTSRAELMAKLATFEAKFAEGPVPRPPHWGGYRVVPDRIELWFGRRDRLHDRFVYARALGADLAPGPWTLSRLNP